MYFIELNEMYCSYKKKNVLNGTVITFKNQSGNKSCIN